MVRKQDHLRHHKWEENWKVRIFGKATFARDQDVRLPVADETKCSVLRRTEHSLTPCMSVEIVSGLYKAVMVGWSGRVPTTTKCWSLQSNNITYVDGPLRGIWFTGFRNCEITEHPLKNNTGETKDRQSLSSWLGVKQLGELHWLPPLPTLLRDTFRRMTMQRSQRMELHERGKKEIP